ncbi:hypothetical protein ACFX2A_004455 [Malus domestica]
MEAARKVFDKLLERDVFVRNMVIQGYANVGPLVEALNMYDRIRFSGVPANRYTYPFMLKACGAMRDGKRGRIVHGHVVKCGLDSDLFVGNALIALYSKCEEIETSRRVFDELPEKDSVSWNSMIPGYTASGNPHEALMVFRSMLQDHATCLPDHATLSSMKADAVLGSALITTYANCGRVTTARVIFYQISEKTVILWSPVECDYPLTFWEELGYLVELIRSMPMEAGKDEYGALLGACRIHNNIELAEEAAEKLFALDPENAGRYILLAIMYEDVRRWADAGRVRKLLRDNNVKKSRWIVSHIWSGR